jgi:hypothetical protein
MEGPDAYAWTAKALGSALSHHGLGALLLGAEALQEFRQRHAVLKLDAVHRHGLTPVVECIQPMGPVAHHVSGAEGRC